MDPVLNRVLGQIIKVYQIEDAEGSNVNYSNWIIIAIIDKLKNKQNYIEFCKIK